MFRNEDILPNPRIYLCTDLGPAKVFGVRELVGFWGILANREGLSARRDVAQLGRALCSERRGRRFKSCHPDQFFPSEMVPLGAKRQGETWGRGFGRTKIRAPDGCQSFCNYPSQRGWGYTLRVEFRLARRAVAGGSVPSPRTTSVPNPLAVGRVSATPPASMDLRAPSSPGLRPGANMGDPSGIEPKPAQPERLGLDASRRIPVSPKGCSRRLRAVASGNSRPHPRPVRSEREPEVPVKSCGPAKESGTTRFA